MPLEPVSPLWSVLLPTGHIMHIGEFCECVEMAGRYNARRREDADPKAQVVGYP